MSKSLPLLTPTEQVACCSPLLKEPLGVVAAKLLGDDRGNPVGVLAQLRKRVAEMLDDMGVDVIEADIDVDENVILPETRVTCYGDSARRKFLLYWRVVELFSGLIRWSLLRGVVAQRERRRSPVPGAGHPRAGRAAAPWRAV